MGACVTIQFQHSSQHPSSLAYNKVGEIGVQALALTLEVNKTLDTLV
jgi:hypothetical protein